MATTINPRYHCSQTELYPICRLGWNRCKDAQSEIVLVFPEYTIVYIDGKLNNINSAEQLPDFQARDLTTETDHILLAQLGTLAVKQWNFLDRYINRAFLTNKELIKPNLEAAGSEYHRNATRENPNWEDLSQMLLSGQTYITNNIAILTPVMPANFPTDYNAAKTAFDTKYDQFILKQAIAPEGTIEKISANNAIYDELLFMLSDLKTIAPPEIQDELTFAYLKGIVSPPGPAGLKGTITAQDTGNPVANALLRLKNTDRETTTGPDGKYDFGNIASGKYTLEISASGFITIVTEITIETGVTSTKNYTLTPAP